MKYVMSNNTISVFVNNEVYAIDNNSVNFKEVARCLLEDNYKRVELLMNIPRAIERLSFGNFIVEGEHILYKGKQVHNVICAKILAFIREGQNFIPLFKFLENLYENPSYNSTQQLYSFLEHKNLPITEDGHFLAYKAITANWLDKWTKKIDNSIGAIPQMNRNEVTDDENIHCGPGLHAGSIKYVTGYRSGNDRIVIVKINPRDVVSVPNDVNCQKLRSCRYEVVKEYKDILPDVIDFEEYRFHGDLYDDDDFAQPEDEVNVNYDDIHWTQIN